MKYIDQWNRVCETFNKTINSQQADRSIDLSSSRAYLLTIISIVEAHHRDTMLGVEIKGILHVYSCTDEYSFVLKNYYSLEDGISKEAPEEIKRFTKKELHNYISHNNATIHPLRYEMSRLKSGVGAIDRAIESGALAYNKGDLLHSDVHAGYVGYGRPSRLIDRMLEASADISSDNGLEIPKIFVSGYDIDYEKLTINPPPKTALDIYNDFNDKKRIAHAEFMNNITKRRRNKYDK